MRGFNPKVSSNTSCPSKNDIEPKKLETVAAFDEDPNNLLVLGVTRAVDLEVGVLLFDSFHPPSLSESLALFAALSNNSFYEGKKVTTGLSSVLRHILGWKSVPLYLYLCHIMTAVVSNNTESQ